MVSQLLSPTQPKNLSDAAILAVLASLIFTLYILPKSARIPVFAVIFLFWRAAYNAGIGWLLDGQSKHNRLVLWAKHSHIFEDPVKGTNPYPTLYKLLMCDFVAYCLFAIACFNRPPESWLLFALRWTMGVALFAFNVIVKLDAHRVVKDFAWYWGDHWFLIDGNLTFDGVFEMAP
jgi:phosphatidylethanolamine N-methyltransferase